MAAQVKEKDRWNTVLKLKYTEQMTLKISGLMCPREPITATTAALTLSGGRSMQSNVKSKLLFPLHSTSCAQLQRGQYAYT